MFRAKRIVAIIILWLLIAILLNILVLLLFEFTSPTPFRDTFFGNELATILGLVLGIPFAVELSRWQQRMESASEAEEKRIAGLQRELKFLNIFDLSLGGNLGFVDQSNSLVAPSQPIFGRPDLTRLAATTSAKYEALSDINLAGMIDIIHADLDHLNHMMDLHSQITYGVYSTIVSEDQFNFESRVICDRIREICRSALKSINETLPKINSRIAEVTAELEVNQPGT